MTFSSSKTKHLYNDRKKPAKLTWTQSWRRLNKKGKEEGILKKKYVPANSDVIQRQFNLIYLFLFTTFRARRVVKVQRAIVGATLEELSKKRQATKPVNVATEAALKEVKDRSKTAKKAVVGAQAGGANIPKVQRPIHNNRGGSRR